MRIPIWRRYDTGTFASTGTVVAGKAVALTTAALSDKIHAAGVRDAHRFEANRRTYRRRGSPHSSDSSGLGNSQG